MCPTGKDQAKLTQERVLCVALCLHVAHTYTSTPSHHTHTLSLSLAVAPCRALCLAGLWPQVDALALLAWPQVPRAGLVERQLLGNGSEELAHVFTCLGGCFEEEQTGLASVLLGIGGGDGTLVGRLCYQIELVASKGDDDVLVCLTLELLDPCLGLIERCLQELTVRTTTGRGGAGVRLV
jgi:hypothetical protein